VPVEKENAAAARPESEGDSPDSADSTMVVEVENQSHSGASATATQVLIKDAGAGDSESALADQLHNNDNRIISLLNQKGSNYSFRGIMRSLDMHQQSLARALHRLEGMGFVEKTSAGYRLSIEGSKLTAQPSGQHGRPTLHSLAGKEERERFVQLLQSYIPANVQAEEVASKLAGRWFKNLRWIGLVESEAGDYLLQWVCDDTSGKPGRFRVNLRIVSKDIIIETDAESDTDKVQAMAGSYAIYEYATKAVQDRVEQQQHLMQPRAGGVQVHTLRFRDQIQGRNN